VNRHALREVTRQLRESGGRGVMAVALVAVAAAWAGALLIARARAEQYLLGRDQPAIAVASLAAGAPAAEVVAALRARFPDARARLREPGATRAELAGWFPELAGFFERIEDASFPTLLEVEVEPAQAPAVVEFLRTRPEVALAESSLAWQGDLEQTLRRVTVAGLGIAFALLFACGAVVVLAVRLLVLEHADEITIMRLIGARDRDIRLPYLVCGSLFGLAGGAIGIAALAGALRLLGGDGAGLPAPLVAGILVVSTAVGTVGAALGLAALPSEP
jgi:cell division transport system permease protein